MAVYMKVYRGGPILWLFTCRYIEEVLFCGCLHVGIERRSYSVAVYT